MLLLQNHIANILDFQTLEVIPPCFSKGLNMQSGHRQRDSSATKSTPHIYRSSGGPQSQGAKRHKRLEVVKQHLIPSTKLEKKQNYGKREPFGYGRTEGQSVKRRGAGSVTGVPCPRSGGCMTLDVLNPQNYTPGKLTAEYFVIYLAVIWSHLCQRLALCPSVKMVWCHGRDVEAGTEGCWGKG